MQRQQPFWSGELVEPEQDETNRQTKRGWPPLSLPLLLALCGHGLLFWLLSQQSWLRPEQSSASDVVIETYFYQPPSRINPEPVALKPAPDAAELPAIIERPAAEPVMLDEADESALPADSYTFEQADTAVIADKGVTEQRLVDDAAPVVSESSMRGSLMERALRQVQPAQDMASLHRAEQQQRQAQPEITVAKRYQQIPTDPARQVIAKLDNGQHIIRTKDGCRIADPGKDGFEGLMAASKVLCGDEVDTGQQLQEILQRRARHSSR